LNERIKELALHSKLRPALLLHYWGKIDALTDSEQEELEQLEKFAELIVAECLKIAKNREDEFESAGLLDESNAVGNVAYRISRQFGVKR
jgi:hypothetical protein